MDRLIFDNESQYILDQFFKQNKDIKIKDFNFNNNLQIEQLNWSGFESKQDALVRWLKAYQRVLRIFPYNDSEAIFNLLILNIHSALQIAKMEKKDFIKTWLTFSQDENTAKVVFDNALCKREHLLIQFMDYKQNNESHIKAAKF